MKFNIKENKTVYINGKRVSFKKGSFETNDKDTIDVFSRSEGIVAVEAKVSNPAPKTKPKPAPKQKEVESF